MGNPVNLTLWVLGTFNIIVTLVACVKRCTSIISAIAVLLLADSNLEARFANESIHCYSVDFMRRRLMFAKLLPPIYLYVQFLDVLAATWFMWIVIGKQHRMPRNLFNAFQAAYLSYTVSLYTPFCVKEARLLVSSSNIHCVLYIAFKVLLTPAAYVLEKHVRRLPSPEKINWHYSWDEEMESSKSESLGPRPESLRAKKCIVSSNTAGATMEALTQVYASNTGISTGTEDVSDASSAHF